MEEVSVRGANEGCEDGPRGYAPRDFNAFEIQIMGRWNGNKIGVEDLIDRWVRTVTNGSDLTESRVGAVIEKIVANMRERYDVEISPLAAADEIREMMVAAGLDPDR